MYKIKKLMEEYKDELGNIIIKKEDVVNFENRLNRYLSKPILHMLNFNSSLSILLNELKYSDKKTITLEKYIDKFIIDTDLTKQENRRKITILFGTLQKTIDKINKEFEEPQLKFVRNSKNPKESYIEVLDLLQL